MNGLGEGLFLVKLLHLRCLCDMDEESSQDYEVVNTNVALSPHSVPPTFIPLPRTLENANS